MSSRAKASPPRLPLGVLFILTLCACSLALHFVLEGLAAAVEQPALELDEPGNHAHLTPEHCDDPFIFTFPERLPIEHTALLSEFSPLTGTFAFAISPLLPPPNSQIQAG